MQARRPRTTPLRVALAGAGMISWRHLEAWRRQGERIRLVAVVDPDLARAERRAEEFAIPRAYADPEAMLAAEAIDALDIASPRATHSVWIDRAAAHGIDVLCQKPLTPTLAQARELVGRVGGRIRLMAHENWRFRPWYRELGRWVATGLLGDVHYAGMRVNSSALLTDASGRSAALDRQPFMRHEKRLMIAEALIHHLDVLRFLCGPLRVIDARTARTLADIEGDTLATIFLESTSGAPVVVHGTMAAAGLPADSGDCLELLGSKASALLHDAELRLLGPSECRLRYHAESGYQTSFDAAIGHFVECLSTGARFETDFTDNLETLRLVEDAYCAAESATARGAARRSQPRGGGDERRG